MRAAPARRAAAARSGESMPGTNAPHPELECAERHLQRLWYDLAMAEQRGQPAHVLERLGRLYMRALEDYIQLSHRLEQPLAS
jgi:hypothetical protein